MVMKLLSKTEAKEASIREQRDAAELKAKLDEEINEKKRELNQLVDSYSKRTNDLAVGFEQFSNAIASKKSQLEREVEELEARKKEALKPIDEIREAAIKLGKENESRASALSDEEKSVAQSKSQVLQSLIDVEELRDKINAKKIELDVREDGVRRQEEFVGLSQTELNNKWSEFYATVAKKNSEYGEKDSALLAKNHSLDVLIKENKIEKEESVKERIRNADERATLERAMKRIKK